MALGGPDIIMIVAGAVSVAGAVWLLVIAFREKVIWGLGCLFFPPVSLIFAGVHWPKAKRPLLIELAGLYGLLIALRESTAVASSVVSLGGFAGSGLAIALGFIGVFTSFLNGDRAATRISFYLFLSGVILSGFALILTHLVWGLAVSGVGLLVGYALIRSAHRTETTRPKRRPTSRQKTEKQQKKQKRRAGRKQRQS